MFANRIISTIIFVLSALVILTGWTDAGAEWHYTGDHGTKEWCSINPQCCSLRQSPVNIDSSLTVGVAFSSLQFSFYDRPSELKIVNNGHTAVYSFVDPNFKPTVSGGGLPGTFVFASLHVHFGSSDNRGSEHTIDNKSYPMEMHMVHYNQKYKGLADAVANTDGLAVLGILFKRIENGTQFMDPLSIAANKTQFEDQTQELDKKVALRSLLPADVETFYRYEGSLTTPTCDEVVTWTVFTDKVPISAQQIASFRVLHSRHLESEELEHPHFIADNYRPPQSLHGRTVYLRSLGFSGGARPNVLVSMIAILTMTALLFR